MVECLESSLKGKKKKLKGQKHLEQPRTKQKSNSSLKAKLNRIELQRKEKHKLLMSKWLKIGGSKRY